MKFKYIFVVIFLITTTSALGQFKKVKIADAEISYIDSGAGVPVVFVHGGMEDYRTWVPQLDSFSKTYRVIDYSRRFNYPNHNTKKVSNFSAQTEANDLAQLIIQLRLPPVHLVGHSFGALTALTLAIQYPQLVRSLTLSEPPMISWLPGLPGGEKLYSDFYTDLWKPVKHDFEQNDTAAVMRHTVIYFYGSDITREIPSEDWKQLIANLAEWRAFAYSSNAFPAVSKQDVQNLKMPILLMSAGQTMTVLKVTNAELRRLLPSAANFQLAGGTHDYWVTNPKEMGNALLNFLLAIQ